MEYIPVLIAIAVFICLPTAIIDMMMNGSKDAGWAPVGLGISLVGWCILTFGYGWQ